MFNKNQFYNVTFRDGIFQDGESAILVKRSLSWQKIDQSINEDNNKKLSEGKKVYNTIAARPLKGEIV